MNSPFACTYSAGVPSLLTELNCSLAISTYQVGKVLFLSPSGADSMRLLPRDFVSAMGMTIRGDKMALATKQEVVVFGNAPGLANSYPDKPGFYDTFFVPRATFYTGQVDIHDMDWDAEGRLWAVNTAFSCLVNIDADYSFRPQWMPPFLSKALPGDFCHLNGMAMKDGQAKYVTMFGKSSSAKGWRAGVEQNGILMDVQSNEFIAEGLPMPHSPRVFDDQLFCLFSATGELVLIDAHSGNREIVYRHEGFVRGLAKHGDYLFVGLSKIRKSASVLRELSIAQESVACGIDIIHLPTGGLVGYIRFEGEVQEIYDVQIIADSLRPGILNHTSEKHRGGIHTPTDDFWAERD